MSTRDLIAAEIEQSELTRDDDLPADAVAKRPGREAARVYSVRLAPDVVEELERVSNELDVPTSALIRGYIADGLAARGTASVAGVADRIEAELRQLRHLIG